MTDNTNSEAQAGQGVRHIPLGNGRFAMIDEADFEWISSFKWHAMADGERCYAARSVPGQRHPIRMHRMLLDAPKAFFVDHRDGNGLNNTRANIRLATHAENSRNIRQSPNQKRGRFKGVTHHMGRWRARINLTEAGVRRSIYLGHFALPEQAARAYDAAAVKYFGEFAATNFAHLLDGKQANGVAQRVRMSRAVA